MTMRTREITNPNVTRSRFVLEIASEMIGGKDLESVPPYFQAKAVLRSQRLPGRTITLFGSSTAEGIEAVTKREADLAIINPAAVLSVAVKGAGMFKYPRPLRAVSVIPSWDQFVFAVRPETGLKTLEDIALKRPRLTIVMRGMAEHTLHPMFDDVAACAGFSRDDIKAWGGEVRKEGFLPYPGSAKFEALVAGKIDAIFDEAAAGWANAALEAGLTLLPLGEETVRKLEAMGYRRAVMPRAAYPRLPADLLTLDFSGWTAFVHAEAEDALVTEICAGLDARKDQIPWEEPGPLPVERMCREARDTPQTVPLHPAAERYWRSKGYLP